MMIKHRDCSNAASIKYTFLQLRMANRQNCLNAGAKLDTPPRVGAERLADVRN